MPSRPPSEPTSHVMLPLHLRRLCSAALAITATLVARPHSLAAQVPAAGPTSPEPVLGIRMGTKRRPLNDYLVARGWVLVADSIAEVGTPSLHTGTLAGRPAEVVAMFGPSTGRLVNLAITVPAASAEELRAAYSDLYRMLERTRCAPKVPNDYVAQRDSILRGAVPHLPAAGSVSTFKPLLPGHTTLTPTENTDWPRPTWANADAQLGTQLTASRLDAESRWPYQATVWSSVTLLLEGATMCADSRAAEEAAARADRDARLARRRARPAGGAPVLDSVVVIAGPGVTIRVDALVVRGIEKEPDGVVRILRRPLDSTIRYDVTVAPAYEALRVVAGDTAAAPKGTFVLDSTSMLVAMAQPRPRAETKRLHELMRAELTSKAPLVAFVAVECEMERLRKQYPATADQWIEDAQARAHDPEKDAKAMRRFDDAMGGHVFGGCAEDLKRYPATGQGHDLR